MTRHWRRIAALIPVLVAVAFFCSPAWAAWEPSKPIEFVIPAGTGGGADQMARLIAGIVEKHKLSPRPIIVVNKSGGAGAEGFLQVKGKKGDAHTIIITLSNLFTTPLATGIPLLCLAAAEALWTLFGSRRADGGEARDFQLSIGKDTPRRTLVASGWILAFFAAIVLLGFPIAVPLFVLLYLRLQGREGWVVTIAMTAAVAGVFYGLFDAMLHLPFPAGWVVSWLGFFS